MNIYVFYDSENGKNIVLQVKEEVLNLRQLKKILRLQCLNKRLFCLTWRTVLHQEVKDELYNNNQNVLTYSNTRKDIYFFIQE